MGTAPARVIVEEGLRAISVACGAVHTAIVMDSGDLFTWGKGGRGQLGHSDKQDQRLPKRVESTEWRSGLGVRVVACGTHHTAAVTSDGSVFTFGAGDATQLGHGPGRAPAEDTALTEVSWLRGRSIVSCAASTQHTAVVLADGTLHTFGDSDPGRLGRQAAEEEFGASVPGVVMHTAFGCRVRSVACNGHI